jgi:quinoprotein glucose dehydrogenase
MKLEAKPSDATRRARPLKVGLGVLAGVAACAAASVLSAQAPSPEELSGLPDAPGRDVFAAACSSCHALGLAASKRRSPEEWQEIMERMVGFGAEISEADFKTIHTYLAQNLAPVRATQAPVAAPAAAAGNAPAARYPRPSGENQWSAYGGGPLNQNFSPLTQITPANVAKLKPAWTYRYGAGRTTGGDQGLDYRFEVTPLMIGGVMYISTPASPRTPYLKAAISAI